MENLFETISLRVKEEMDELQYAMKQKWNNTTLGCMEMALRSDLQRLIRLRRIAARNVLKIKKVKGSK